MKDGVEPPGSAPAAAPAARDHSVRDILGLDEASTSRPPVVKSRRRARRMSDGGIGLSYTGGLSACLPALRAPPPARGARPGPPGGGTRLPGCWGG